MGRKYSYGSGKKYGKRVVRVESIHDALIFQRSFGFPVSVRIAADVAGVSRQRIHTLLRKGRFTCVIFRGEPHISIWELWDWMKSRGSAIANGKSTEALAPPETLHSAANSEKPTPIQLKFSL